MMERIAAESGHEIPLNRAESWFSKQRKKEFHKTGRNQAEKREISKTSINNVNV